MIENVFIDFGCICGIKVNWCNNWVIVRYEEVVIYCYKYID